MNINLESRGTEYVEINGNLKVPADDQAALEFYDLSYRTLCAVMFNHTASGHPGGSVSSGRIVTSLIFNQLRYDLSNPMNRKADIVSYAAGHKALGLYAMFACRNEVAQQQAPQLLPRVAQQLRLEDLLGFRKNPITKTPLFVKFGSKPLDGHPTPQTPFVWLSTGPSGVGVASSVGLALALKDIYPDNSPHVHVIEGEGGMTPGRVSEALAAAATSGLDNFFFHVDWNQASIDSEHVTREGKVPGEYVQWDPCEFLLVHGFNVIFVKDGFSFPHIREAQSKALALANGHPTAIVYRTVKGWQYGIEGSKSHGAGHKFYSDAYLQALAPFEQMTGLSFPRFLGEQTPEHIEQAYYDSLLVIRQGFQQAETRTTQLAQWLVQRKALFEEQQYVSRPDGPDVELLYQSKGLNISDRPKSCVYPVGSEQTLRGALADVMNYVNQLTKGSVLAAAADLYGSTSISTISKGFGSGFWHPVTNPSSRLFSSGGITEDAMSGICSGISTMGHHLAVGSSYGAFIAPLGVISAKTHAIGQQTLRHRAPNEPNRPFMLICGHAGVKTGEDGPTHAEPHALQILQENYPGNLLVTLTPWDPMELWPLTVTALQHRPAVIAPFVTRPNEKILDRVRLGLADCEACVTGVYPLLKANGKADANIIYQGSEVAYVFAQDVLPHLRDKGLNVNVYYIASVELFDLLPREQRDAILPESVLQHSMMITGFTPQTTYRWVMSQHGRDYTLYPWKQGEFLGSGAGHVCLQQAGMHGEGQWQAIERYIETQ